MVKKSDKPTGGVGFLDIPVSNLVKADWNYKKEDAALTGKLTANIKRNGMIENLLVRELPNKKGFYEVVNGNHRFDVCKDLGMRDVHVYNLGKISESQAKRVAIATNETKFENDEIKLSETLKELQTNFGVEEMLAELPYSQSELQARLELLDFDWGEDYAGSGNASKSNGATASDLGVSAGEDNLMPKSEQPLEEDVADDIDYPSPTEDGELEEEEGVEAVFRVEVTESLEVTKIKNLIEGAGFRVVGNYLKGSFSELF